MVQTLDPVLVICGSNDDNDDKVGGKWTGAPIFDHLRGFAAPYPTSHPEILMSSFCPRIIFSDRLSFWKVESSFDGDTPSAETTVE